MSKKGRNQQGFTLIEVLLSIIILFIILISFMGFFTQSALFSNKNEQKLGTIETAQKVINLVEENITKQELINRGIINTAGIVTNGTYLLTDKTSIESILNKPINSNFSISGIFSNNSSDNLIQFKVIVQDPQDSGSKSETYTYIRR